MSTIYNHSCIQDTNYANLSAYGVNTYDYMHTPLYKIYYNLGIEGLTRPPLHPNLFSFHTFTNQHTPLNPLIIERLKLGLTDGQFDNYNLNQMTEFFDDCDARIIALDSKATTTSPPKVTCDNCGVGLGIWWEIKPTRTSLWAVCYNCHNNLSNVDVIDDCSSSDYQENYCIECGVECGSGLCKYCDNRCNDCGVECGPGGCPRCDDEYDDVGRCGDCGADCGAYLCRYCRRDYN